MDRIMRIAICDDEQNFLDKIERYILQYETKRNEGISIVRFQSGERFLDFYKESQNIDLVILDILMNGIDGMQVAKEIRKYGTHTKIAFLTSTDKYAIQGYVVNACRYWMKPITYKQFVQEMDMICQQIENDNQQFFYEKIGTTIKRIYFNDICYIETCDRKSKIHTIRDEIVTSRNMKAYETLLKSNPFFRCHAAYIVNMDYIKEINGMEIILKNDAQIYISKNRKKEFFKVFAEFMGQMLMK